MSGNLMTRIHSLLLVAVATTLSIACSTPSGRENASADDGTVGATRTGTAASTSAGSTSELVPTTAADEPTSSTGASTGAIATTNASSTSTGEDETTVMASASSTGECVPSGADETVCDLVDDDCNGIVDDVDVGGDGICDCLRLGLFGKSGGLNEANFQKWLEDRGTAVTVFGDEPTLAPALFAQVDIMIIGWLSRTYTAEEGLALRAWIEAGGGVMMMNGYSPDPQIAVAPYNVVLADMGLEFHGPLLNDVVTQWTDHPVGAGLTAVNFIGGYWIRALADMPDAAAPIASMGGDTVAIAHTRGAGRMVIWGDEWIKYDSEWMTPDVPALWVNIFNYIGPTSICTVPG
jgi:hypothetical protein